MYVIQRQTDKQFKYKPNKQNQKFGFELDKAQVFRTYNDAELALNELPQYLKFVCRVIKIEKEEEKK